MQKYNQLVFPIASFHVLNNISNQHLQRPAKVSSQSQLLRVHIKHLFLLSSLSLLLFELFNYYLEPNKTVCKSKWKIYQLQMQILTELIK